MQPFSELSGKEKSVEILRWVCVPAAAVLGCLAVRFAGTVVVRMVMSGWESVADSVFASCLRFLLFYVPKETAFVVAGATMAPRNRLTAGLFLAVAGILMSLVVHIVGQRRPGIINMAHFALESAGAAIGLVCLFGLQRSLDRKQQLSRESEAGK